MPHDAGFEGGFEECLIEQEAAAAIIRGHIVQYLDTLMEHGAPQRKVWSRNGAIRCFPGEEGGSLHRPRHGAEIPRCDKLRVRLRLGVRVARRAKHKQVVGPRVQRRKSRRHDRDHIGPRLDGQGPDS